MGYLNRASESAMEERKMESRPYWKSNQSCGSLTIFNKNTFSCFNLQNLQIRPLVTWEKTLYKHVYLRFSPSPPPSLLPGGKPIYSPTSKDKYKNAALPKILSHLIIPAFTPRSRNCFLPFSPPAASSYFSFLSFYHFSISSFSNLWFFTLHFP